MKRGVQRSLSENIKEYLLEKTIEILKKDFEKSSGETERMGLLYPFQELSGRFDYKDFNYNQRLSNLNDVQKKHIEKFER